MSEKKELQEDLYAVIKDVDERKKLSYTQNWGTCLAMLDLVESEELYEGLGEAIIQSYDRQHALNNYKEKEWLKLLNVFEEKGIKVINFKGLSLANDLYDSIDYRKSNDIDILISENDIEKVLIIVDDFGYTVKRSGRQPKDLIEEYLSRKKDKLREIKHLKPVVKFVDDKKMQIDIHINANKNLLKGSFNSLYDNAVKADYKGNTIYVLELHDRIINLAGHLKEHFDSDINCFFNHENVVSLTYRFGQLYDIVLMLEKYKEEIDWNYMLKRSQELGHELSLIFSLKLVAYVYKNNDCVEKINKMVGSYCSQNSFVTDSESMDRLIHYIVLDNWKEDFVLKPEKYIIRAFYGVTNENEIIVLEKDASSSKIATYNKKKKSNIEFEIKKTEKEIIFKFYGLPQSENVVKVVLFNLQDTNEIVTIRTYISLDFEKKQACIDGVTPIQCDMEAEKVKLLWKDIWQKDIQPEKVFMCMVIDVKENGCVEQYKWPEIKYMVPTECGKISC